MQRTSHSPPAPAEGFGATPIATDSVAADTHRKRNRIRYSCTTCRDKKLKCNRHQPCDQCEKRGIGPNCGYVPYLNPRAVSGTRAGRAPRSQQSHSADTETETLLAKLRHLEGLVNDLQSNLRERGVEVPTAPIPTSKPTGLGAQHVGDRPATPRDRSGISEPTPAGPMVDKLRYVDAANWEAVLDDITRLTAELKTGDDALDEDEGDPEEPSLNQSLCAATGPILLLGTFPPATMTELIALLPPRDITDRLISRFFKGKEPTWCIFHVPTFLKTYEQFWVDPHRFSLTWLGLLFVMISHAALFCLRGDEEVPGSIGTPQWVVDTYRLYCAQCLALDDYTTPGKYKVEAMLLYFGIEYLRQADAQRGTSIVLSITVRLAMHSGLHRDPKHFQGISAFEGEMRKRLWKALAEIDLLIAFQFGLPANVQSRFFDTGLPHNLRDEDFDESTTELPPERPLTERTPALYFIVKAPLGVAFGNIFARMADRDTPTYNEVLRLHDQLEAAYESVPAILSARSFSLSIADPIDVIMQRLWIELMYLKARIVLHRRYFTLGRNDPRYTPSRLSCIDAATRILELQYDIHSEYQPGGRLSRERWFISSLSTHDFLLADMMLCLELSYLLKQEDSSSTNGPIGKDELLSILRTSRNIWWATRKDSAEANRAFKILSRMLSISTGTKYESSPGTSGAEYLDFEQRPSYQFSYGPDMQSCMQQQQFATTWVEPGVPVALNNPGGPLPDAAPGMGVSDPSLTLDWADWDTQIQNAGADMIDLPWADIFQPGHTLGRLP